MKEYAGTYNTAKVFTNNIEKSAEAQIEKLLEQKFVEGSKIRIMPDVHMGAGCTIGTTMTIKDKIVPNLVGVDIGCGMETVILKNSFIELEALDKVIHESIPSGFSIRKDTHPLADTVKLSKLKCYKEVNIKRAMLSIGTLGGGNHFIEVGKDVKENIYIVIHSGSRNLGKQIAEYYQKMAYRNVVENNIEIKKTIQKLKNEGKEKEIQKSIKAMKVDVDKTLAYVDGYLFDDYLNDMKIAQYFAEQNRKAMIDVILKKLKLKASDSFTTIHNYIDIDNMILRKGAISAQKGERSLIPINMRDGSLLCIGKGNEDWNFSAPHGAGRLMSRTKAKESFTLSEYKKSMVGIYSTTVNKYTLDEAPFAYKPIDEIMENTQDTIDIIETIKPIYNFKAAE